MPSTHQTRIPSLIERNEASLLAEWMKLQQSPTNNRHGRIAESQLQESSRAFLAALRQALLSGGISDLSDSSWSKVREVLQDLSRTRAEQGFSPSDTATFVFSLKQPLFEHLRRELSSDTAALAEEIWLATTLLDRLGLYTVESFQTSREKVISAQQQEMLELSTPVVGSGKTFWRCR